MLDLSLECIVLMFDCALKGYIGYQVTYKRRNFSALITAPATLDPFDPSTLHIAAD